MIGRSERVRQASDLAVASWVLVRSGIVDVLRPDRMALAYLDVKTFGPIATPVRISARRSPYVVAVADETRSLTYRELDRTTDRLATALARRGHDRTAVVATLCRDHVELVQAMVAAGKIGARLVLLNTSMSAVQTAEVCRREGVSLLIHDAEFRPVVERLPDDVRTITARTGEVDGRGADTLSGLIEANGGSGLRRPRRSGGIVALTGGTTGLPKGAVRSSTSPFGAAQLLDRLPLRRGGTTLFAAPMFHGTGLSQFVLSLSLGRTNLLKTKFDAAECLREIEARRVDTLVLVPTMLLRILDCPDLTQRDCSSLAIIFSAGSAIPVAVGNRAIERFGPVLYNLYGSSEVGVVAVAKPADWIAAPGTAGRPPATVTVRLYDNDSKPVTTRGALGTIYAASALSFDGYTGGGTKSQIDGLLSTGDVGYWDSAGRLHVTGRDDDMIVSGGENVFPGEIEDLLFGHPKIRDAAAVGVPDHEFGQRLAVALVVEPGEALTVDEVKDFVRSNLARYKVPRDVAFLDEIPRTPSGKTLRRQLFA